MKLKQIKFLFKTLFRKPKASIVVKVYEHGTLMDVSGNGIGFLVALHHILEEEKFKPLIAEVQAQIVKSKIGIDPREVISHAMESAMEEKFGKPIKPKKTERTVN